MTVLVVITWMVKPEKHEEFKQMWNRYLEYKRQNPEMFKELRSRKPYTQMFGDIVGAYAEMVEFNNVADYDKMNTRLLEDESFKRIFQKFKLLIEPTTYSINVWKAIE